MLTCKVYLGIIVIVAKPTKPWERAEDEALIWQTDEGEIRASTLMSFLDEVKVG